MDSLRNRSNNLREELAELVADQADLNREVRAWTLVDEADRPRIAKILMLRQVQDADEDRHGGRRTAEPLPNVVAARPRIEGRRSGRGDKDDAGNGHGGERAEFDGAEICRGCRSA